MKLGDKPKTTLTSDGLTTQFVYDGDGNMVKKINPSREEIAEIRDAW